MIKPIYTSSPTAFGLDIIQLDDPGAGNNFNYTPPDDHLHRLVTAHFTLTTDATVANRVVRLQGVVGSAAVFDSPATYVQAASLIYKYHFSMSSNALAHTATSLHVGTNISSSFYLAPGGTIRSEVDGLVAGDVIKDVVLYLQWFTINR